MHRSQALRTTLCAAALALLLCACSPAGEGASAPAASVPAEARLPTELERVAMEEVRQGVIPYTLPTVDEVQRGRRGE